MKNWLLFEGVSNRPGILSVSMSRGIFDKKTPESKVMLELAPSLNLLDIVWKASSMPKGWRIWFKERRLFGISGECCFIWYFLSGLVDFGLFFSGFEVFFAVFLIGFCKIFGFFRLFWVARACSQAFFDAVFRQMDTKFSTSNQSAITIKLRLRC